MKTWSSEDREAFFARLKRSRDRYSRAQYLKIQSLSLADVGNFNAAEELADIILSDYLDQKSEIEQAMIIKGDCLAERNQFERGIEMYLRAAKFKIQSYPNQECGAWWKFGVAAISTGRVDLFEDLHFIMESRDRESLIMSDDFFYHFGICAVLSWHRRKNAEARQFAKEAWEFANRENSGMRYHPTLGLVDEGMKQSKFARVVRQIADNEAPEGLSRKSKSGFAQKLFNTKLN